MIRRFFSLFLILSLLIIPAHADTVLDEISYGAKYQEATIIRGTDISYSSDNYISVAKIDSSGNNRIIPLYRIDKYINGELSPSDRFVWETLKTYTFRFRYNCGDTNITGVQPQGVYLGDSWRSDTCQELRYYFGTNNCTVSYVKSTPNIIDVVAVISTAVAGPMDIATEYFPTNILVEMAYSGGQMQMELNVGTVDVQTDTDGTVYEREVLNLLMEIKSNQENYFDKEYEDALSRVDADDLNKYGISDIGDISSISQALSNIINSLSYDGTDCKWVFPSSGDIPYVGKLWDEHEIDFGFWMEKIPDPLLYCARFSCMFSLAWWVLHEVFECINIFGGGESE